MPTTATAHEGRPYGGPHKSVPMKVLSVSAAEEDHSTLRLCVADMRCDVVPAPTCSSALNLLDRGDISIVICDSNLPDGTWRDILKSFRNASDKLILIVSSHCADGYLWAEVLNLGGFDVIAKPFRITELHHVLETARLGNCGAPRPAAAAG
jgi:DNA-binding response OmpR family regulator